jgi:hypothetical protein
LVVCIPNLIYSGVLFTNVIWVYCFNLGPRCEVSSEQCTFNLSNELNCLLGLKRLRHSQFQHFREKTATRTGSIKEQCKRMLNTAVSTKRDFRGMSPRANCTDRATAACRRSYCQLLQIDGAACSVRQVPTTKFSVFWTGVAIFSFKYVLSCTHEAKLIPFQTHYFSENLVVPGIDPGPLDLWPVTLTTTPQRGSVLSTSE